MDIDVKHTTSERAGRFFVEGSSKDLGYLEYRVDGDTFTIEHTAVEEELAGTGAARKLVDEAVRFATGKQYKIESTCEYASHVLEKYYNNP